MRRLVLVGVWVSVIASGVGFVLPWASIQTGALPGQINQALNNTGLDGLTNELSGTVSRVTLQFKRGAETITGDLPDLSKLPSQVNGPDIPTFVNRKDNAVAIALAEMLTGQRDISKKSYAVYLVPGLALLLGLVVTALAGGRHYRDVARPPAGALVAGGPAACWAVAAVSAVVAGAGFWKLLTTNTQSLMVAITIGPGLWLSLWAYVGLAACAVLLVLSSRPHQPS